MSKRYFNLDERERRLVQQISTVLYILTLYTLVGFQLYRQFVLHQPMEAWNDIAILITVNVIVWIGAVLYLSGTVNPKVVSLRHLLLGFVAFVIFGLAFTLFKYTVLLGQTMGIRQIWDALITVLKVSALLTAFWGFLAFIGNKLVEKRIR